jgi:methyltransferase
MLHVTQLTIFSHEYPIILKKVNLFVLFALIALIIVQRLLELGHANRNLAWARANGGQEFAPEHYPFMVALHSSWILALLIEGWLRGATTSSLWWLWLGLFIIAQVLRYMIILSLGKLWNTRIIIVPNAKLVRSGIYSFFKHPNYMVVALELLVTPLIFNAWLTAIIFSVLNAILLLGFRIPAEERALETLSN